MAEAKRIMGWFAKTNFEDRKLFFIFPERGF
jgi:hypothetical protein